MNCVCGHLKHGVWTASGWRAIQCFCGCTMYELDDGTDVSPTHTGYAYGSGVFGYDGRYGGNYSI